MKKINILLLTVLTLFTLTSCFEDLDDNAIASADIKDFVWKAMNAYYLYNDPELVPDLANDRFGINGIDNRYEKTEEYSEYLDGFSSPEELFESLDYEPLDPFSLIVPNYFDVLNAQQGTTKSNGLEFRFYFLPQTPNDIFGVISLVLPNSNASSLGLQRGQVFNAVDGVPLTADNFSDFLSLDSYTLNFADYNDNDTPTDTSDDSIVSNSNSASLNKETYNENPVFETEVFFDGVTVIGYLMYNGFNNNYRNALNAAFQEFQTNGVEHLVLDLRYNGGGSIQNAVYLGSMITGQYTGQVFSRAFFNENQQSQNRDYEFTQTFSDGTPLNSLNLNKLYVLTSNRTASASELIINSLRPYLSGGVIHIGESTVGKTQINKLVLDSQNFDGDGVNTRHTYGLIPLIGDSTNKDNELVPSVGFTPDIEIRESAVNFGILGDPDEPLLAAAIADITGTGRPIHTNNIDINEVKSSKQYNSIIEQIMYED